jgi:hypothetical protein
LSKIDTLPAKIEIPKTHTSSSCSNHFSLACQRLLWHKPSSNIISFYLKYGTSRRKVATCTILHPSDLAWPDFMWSHYALRNHVDLHVLHVPLFFLISFLHQFLLNNHKLVNLLNDFRIIQILFSYKPVKMCLEYILWYYNQNKSLLHINKRCSTDLNDQNNILIKFLLNLWFSL